MLCSRASVRIDATYLCKQHWTTGKCEVAGNAVEGPDGRVHVLLRVPIGLPGNKIDLNHACLLTWAPGPTRLARCIAPCETLTHFLTMHRTQSPTIALTVIHWIDLCTVQARLVAC